MRGGGELSPLAEPLVLHGLSAELSPLAEALVSGVTNMGFNTDELPATRTGAD